MTMGHGWYNIVWPMGHGWYNTVQPMGYRMVRVLYGPWVMGGTTLYGPWVMELYIVVQRCMAHGSWGFCHDVWPMGHGKKIAEEAREQAGLGLGCILVS